MIGIEEAQRNGWGREKTSGIRGKAAKIYRRIFPDHSANRLSLEAALLNMIASANSAHQNENLSPSAILPRIPNLALAAMSALGDSIDGKLAALIEEETGKKSKGGAELDTALDRVTTTFRVIARARSARARDDWPGEVLAYTEGATSLLTSLGRKWAASRNVVVPEEGKGIAIIGTHPIRTALAIVSTDIQSLQKPLDALSIIGDVTNAANRFWLGYTKGDGENPAEKRRLRALTIQAAMTAGILAGHFVYSRINSSGKAD